ncbi:MAG: DUF488 domain-containing protein [Planctomycetota bacterium]|nr:DUF488 domain-containing protein [Planctomycetota bacterium]
MSDSTDPKPTLLTIGHSDHEAAEFVALLARHKVDAIADVRSQPYSRFHSQFNRETLMTILRNAGIKYTFLGRELGARRAEPECYRGTQVQYDLVAKLPAFQEGLARVRHGLATYRIALLCAEKDPITCHRTILVCRQFREDPIAIEHIREDGSAETMEHAEDRLLEATGLPAADLFRGREALVEEAYKIQSGRIAYTEAGAEPAESGVSA